MRIANVLSVRRLGAQRVLSSRIIYFLARNNNFRQTKGKGELLAGATEGRVGSGFIPNFASDETAERRKTGSPPGRVWKCRSATVRMRGGEKERRYRIADQLRFLEIIRKHFEFALEKWSRGAARRKMATICV